MTFYYLEEHTSKCILAISEDVYLINNIRSGFDSLLKFTEHKETAEYVKRHLEGLHTIGITIIDDKPIPVSLKNFEQTVENIRLVTLRKPCFEKLLQCVRNHKALNKIGFISGDEFYIQHALSNQHALEEYAQVHNISADFARKELTLLSESVIRDNFRVFTVATLLKNKINQMTDQNQVSDILDLINRSFSLYGISDV